MISDSPAGGLGATRLGDLEVSRLIIGGNPFSGFSHQTPARDDEMRHWYSSARIKDALREAESIGVNAHIGRADHHVMRFLMEYWDEGGTIRWIAQTCPELGEIQRGVHNAIQGGASACYVHGGVMDHLFANQQLDSVRPATDMIRGAGLPAGIACHNPHVLDWAEDQLDVDFYMCSYYNSAHRDKNAELQSGQAEWFHDADRSTMTARIAGLSRPAIHYKVLAAGRNDPADAFDVVAEHLRPQDACCVGVFTKDGLDMLAEDAQFLAAALERRGKPG
jgi:hypothetical protein